MNCSSVILSEDYLDLIIPYEGSPSDFESRSPGICPQFLNLQYAVAHFPVDRNPPISFSSIPYFSIPKLYTLCGEPFLESSGILPATRIPAFSNEGRGVLVGFLDTGISVSSPAFRYSDGSTRILGIWDQSTAGGPLPEPGIFSPSYGSVFSASEIDTILKKEQTTEPLPACDHNGHGTFLASVACGSPSPSGLQGAAPLSSIGVVKLKPAKKILRDFFMIPDDALVFEENDIMAGITYLCSLAYSVKMPLVLCLSCGTFLGSHTGNSPLGHYLNALSRLPGLAVITAAGNELGLSHHFHGSVSGNRKEADVELRVAEGENGFVMEFWAQNAASYEFSLLSPSRERIPRISLKRSEERTFQFLTEQTSVTVSAKSTDSLTGRQLLFFRFQNPAAGIWHLFFSPTLSLTGSFDLWLPSRGLIRSRTIFLRPDPDSTILDPGNCPLPITMGAYDPVTGGSYIHSGRGSSGNGPVKPDLSAPGVGITGTGPLSPVTMTGTSAATAITAGAAAILLSWGIREKMEPEMTTASIRSHFIRGAERNPALTYPNPEFGYGTLDLLKSFLSM